MTIENLAKIWQEFKISNQTTNLIVDKVKSIEDREGSNLNRITFTIELLIWICNDPCVAQSLQNDIFPRTIEEFIISFFKKNKDEIRQKIDVLASVLEPMHKRHSYLGKKEVLTSEEEVEYGSTYDGLGSDTHGLYREYNHLTFELVRKEGMDCDYNTPEATISIDDIIKLSIILKK